MSKMIIDLLPPGITVAKETKDLLSDACVEFIHLIASEGEISRASVFSLLPSTPNPATTHHNTTPTIYPILLLLKSPLLCHFALLVQWTRSLISSKFTNIKTTELQDHYLTDSKRNSRERQEENDIRRICSSSFEGMCPYTSSSQTSTIVAHLI